MFFGMIKFRLKAREKDPRQYPILELIAGMGTEDRDNKSIIEWDGSGDEGSYQDCRREIMTFHVNWGGPNGSAQWKADDGDKVIRELFGALSTQHQYPALKQKLQNKGV